MNIPWGRIRSTIGSGFKFADVRHMDMTSVSSVGKMLGRRVGAGAIVGGATGNLLSSKGHKTSGTIKGGVIGGALGGFVPMRPGQNTALSNIGFSDRQVNAAKNWVGKKWSR
jgi:hypothetical protein